MMIGFAVMRLQPLHKGHKKIIDLMLKENDKAILVIGSKDAQDENPYSFKERLKMVHQVYQKEIKKGKLLVLGINDIHNPPKWAQFIKTHLPLPATKYYCYIKSNCNNEVSEWVLDSFQTANVQTLPFVENFNVTATPGYTYMFGTWYVFSNDDKCRPFINSYISTHKDYYSADETFALAIAREDIQGADIEAIPGRIWAYAATPLLDVDDMSKVRMSWKIHVNSCLH